MALYQQLSVAAVQMSIDQFGSQSDQLNAKLINRNYTPTRKLASSCTSACRFNAGCGTRLLALARGTTRMYDQRYFVINKHPYCHHCFSNEWLNYLWSFVQAAYSLALWWSQKNSLINNNPVKLKDVEVTKDIYGPDVGSLKG